MTLETDIRIRIRWAYQTRAPKDRPSAFYATGITAWRLEEGGVRIEASGKRLFFEGPCTLILGPGKRSHRFSGRCRLWSINCAIRGEQGAVFHLPPVLELPGALRFEREIARFVKIFQSARSDGRSRLQSLEMHAETARWGARLGRVLEAALKNPFAVRTAHAGLSRSLRWLEEHPGEHRPGEADIARRAGMSVSQFKRVMRRELGCSFREYMLLRKLEACSEAILHADRPVKQIAQELGFGQASNFIRWFQKHYRQTPAQFRRTQLPRL